MFDLVENNPLLTGWSLFLFLFIALCFWRKNMSTNTVSCDAGLLDSEKQSDSGGWLLYAFLLLFAVTAFCNGDFFHYIEWVESANVNWHFDDTAPQEIVYQYISSALDGAYFPFRFVVWGSALTLIVATAKRLEISVQQTLFVVIILYAVQYSYARATLAMSVYFLGFSFLVKPARVGSIVSILIGIGIISLSVFFHRSMYVLIGLTLIYFTPTFENIRKTRLMLVVLAILNFLLVFFAARIILSLDLGGMIGDTTANKLTTYADKLDIIEYGVAGMILNGLVYIQTWGGLYIITYDLFRDDRIVDKQFVALYKITLAILMTSLAFGFSGQDFYVLTYRIRIMSFIPFSLLTVWALKDGICSKRHFRWIIMSGFISTGYQVLYAFYCSILN